MKADDLTLTPELAKLTRQVKLICVAYIVDFVRSNRMCGHVQFAMVPDPKLRYQQLLFFAAKLGVRAHTLATKGGNGQGRRGSLSCSLAPQCADVPLLTHLW
jgi:hypothetical protein